MINNEKVTQAVLSSIDELNGQLPKDAKLGKSLDTALFGGNGSLDSLGLVSLVTTVEQNIEENFGVTVTLLDDISVIEGENPFKTVKTLSDYVSYVLEKKKSE
jgi:acyl carrier protein